MAAQEKPTSPRTEAGAELIFYLRGALIAYPNDRAEAILAGAREYIVRIERGAAAATPSLPLDVLTTHYVTAIECDHDAKTDTVRCNCSVWTGTPQPSVGAAVREWAEHVLSAAAIQQRRLTAQQDPQPAGGARVYLAAVIEAWDEYGMGQANWHYNYSFGLRKLIKVVEESRQYMIEAQ